VEGENKCKAFASVSSDNSNASSSEKFVDILESRRDPLLCGIEGKMLIPKPDQITLFDALSIFNAGMLLFVVFYFPKF